MSLVSLLRFARGTVTFTVKGAFAERFLNLLSRNEIPVFHTRCTPEGYTAQTTVKHYRRIRPFVRKTHMRVRVVQRNGLPFWVQRYRRRVGLLVGIGLFCLCVGLSGMKSAELTGQWEKKLRMIEDGTYQVADFMEELKAMVNEIVHFVRYSSAKTITVETPEEKDGEDKKTKKEREKGKGKKENGEKIAVVLKCPKCGQGEIVKGKTAWGCTLYRKSCDFLIPMEIQGKKLTQKQVDTLIQKGQTGKISGFKDPEGNSFNGMVRLDENKNIIVDKI